MPRDVSLIASATEIDCALGSEVCLRLVTQARHKRIQIGVGPDCGRATRTLSEIRSVSGHTSTTFSKTHSMIATSSGWRMAVRLE